LLIDLADLLNRRFELLIFGQTALHISNLFFAETNLTNAPAGITDSENRNGMSFPTITLGAAGAVTDDPLEERAANDISGIREGCRKAITFSKNGFSIHYT
jgi:hypothetical protein